MVLMTVMWVGGEGGVSWVVGLRSVDDSDVVGGEGGI